MIRKINTRIKRNKGKVKGQQEQRGIKRAQEAQNEKEN